MAKIAGWSMFDGFRLARALGATIDTRKSHTPEELIAAAEQAARLKPNAWVLFYVLGDKYQEVGRYADAIGAGKRCVELRPKDIRSAYALATAYCMLTRAEWDGSPEHEQMLRDMGDPIPPSVATRELAKTGLSTLEAARQALHWFERAQQLGPDRHSREQINLDAQALYDRYPQLLPKNAGS